MAVPSPALATWPNAWEILEEEGKPNIKPASLSRQSCSSRFPYSDQPNLLVDLFIREPSGVTNGDLWHFIGILMRRVTRCGVLWQKGSTPGIPSSLPAEPHLCWDL